MLGLGALGDVMLRGFQEFQLWLCFLGGLLKPSWRGKVGGRWRPLEGAADADSNYQLR